MQQPCPTCRPASNHSHPWAKAAGFDSGPSSTDSGTHLHTLHYGGTPAPSQVLPEHQPPQPHGETRNSRLESGMNSDVGTHLTCILPGQRVYAPLWCNESAALAGMLGHATYVPSKQSQARHDTAPAACIHPRFGQAPALPFPHSSAGMAEPVTLSADQSCWLATNHTPDVSLTEQNAAMELMHACFADPPSPPSSRHVQAHIRLHSSRHLDLCLTTASAGAHPVPSGPAFFMPAGVGPQKPQPAPWRTAAAPAPRVIPPAGVHEAAAGHFHTASAAPAMSGLVGPC